LAAPALPERTLPGRSRLFKKMALQWQYASSHFGEPLAPIRGLGARF